MKSAAEYVIIAISGAKKSKNGGSAPVRHTVSKPANLKPISEYTAIDDGFSEVEMKEKLSNLYIRMQQCWQNKNIERIAVLSVELEGFAQTETEDKIYAEIKTRIIDYTLDDKTGNVVSGSNTTENDEFVINTIKGVSQRTGK